MKINHVTPMGAAMTEDDVKSFLSSSQINIQIGTVDSKGDQSIQPVWYYYDQDKDRLYVNTGKDSQKVRNIRLKNKVYFSVDEDTFPYRCVKGKATATVSEDVGRNLPVAEKIMIKYLGSTVHPTAAQILESVRSGQSVIIEMAPLYYSTWDFGKS